MFIEEDEIDPEPYDNGPVAATAKQSKTDEKNAKAFRAMYGKKFCWTLATKWMTYADGCWVRDKIKTAELAMSQWCKSTRGRNSALEYASHDPMFAKDYDEFDQHPELLNLKNGTYNLNTEKFGPHNPFDYLTKQCGVLYDATAKCPQWEKHVGEWLKNDPATIAYIQRWCGYMLTADTSEQSYLIFYGGQGTGKGTMTRVLYGIIGTYCETADAEMFMTKRGDSGQPFELARLKGARAVIASEIAHGKRFDTTKLNRMTGEDKITACLKGKDHFDFRPVFKIVIATNHKPSASASDDSFWIRTKPIPFEVTFRGVKGKEIKKLSEKLLAEEGPGILNWFLRGHSEWKRIGLAHPAEVDNAVNEWRGDENFLGRFVDENFSKSDDKNHYVLRSDMYARFTEWSKVNREGMRMGSTDFILEMRRLGFDDNNGKIIKRDGKVVRAWLGLIDKDGDSFNTAR